MAADPFYGPIVAKIDSILQQYSGFLDDNCKEWMICNMYKDPTKYSPHSNFLSAELSRFVWFHTNANRISLLILFVCSIFPT